MCLSSDYLFPPFIDEADSINAREAHEGEVKTRTMSETKAKRVATLYTWKMYEQEATKISSKNLKSNECSQIIGQKSDLNN